MAKDTAAAPAAIARPHATAIFASRGDPLQHHGCGIAAIKVRTIHTARLPALVAKRYTRAVDSSADSMSAPKRLKMDTSSTPTGSTADASVACSPLKSATPVSEFKKGFLPLGMMAKALKSSRPQSKACTLFTASDSSDFDSDSDSDKD